MSGSWEHFEHAADIGVRGLGATMAEAFEQAGIGLTAVVTDPSRVVARETVTIQCEAPDAELLFAEWLNSLIFEMAVRRMLFSRFSVRITGTRLEGEAMGEKIDVEHHRPTVEVKGATYTSLRVEQNTDGQWQAQTVVDV